MTNRPSRRAVLGGATGLLAASAGCLGEAPTSPGADDDERDDDDDDVRLESYDSVGFQRSAVPTAPDAALLLEEGEAEAWLAERDPDAEDGAPVGGDGNESDDGTDDTDDGTDDTDEESDGTDDDSDDTDAKAFVEETSFEESVLVALEADAPTPCHEFALETVEVDDGTLFVEAAVEDAADDDEMCAQQEVSVYLLVRATFEGERGTAASVTLRDRNGDEHEVGFGSETDTAGGSDAEGEPETETSA